METGTPGKSRKEEDPTSVQEKERLERMQKLKEMQRKVKEEKTRVSQQVNIGNLKHVEAGGGGS